jgi:hypothetical protein
VQLRTHSAQPIQIVGAELCMSARLKRGRSAQQPVDLRGEQRQQLVYTLDQADLELRQAAERLLPALDLRHTRERTLAQIRQQHARRVRMRQDCIVAIRQGRGTLSRSLAHRITSGYAWNTRSAAGALHRRR